MSGTEFTLYIIAALNKQLSKKRLQSDLKSMDNSMYVKVIAKLATTLSQRQLKKDLKQLNDLYVQIGAKVEVDKNTKTQLENRIQELQKSLSELEVNLKVSKAKAASEIESVRKEVQAKASKVPVGFDIEVKRSKAIADIEYLGKRFSKLFSNVAAKQKYENILGSAYSITDENQLRSVRNQIAAFTSELKACGLSSQSLGDKWKNLIERAKNLFSAASIVTTIFTQVKQAVSTFLKLDTAMTNLYKVQDQIKSRDQFSGLLTKWNKLAQNLAVTTDSLINSATEWSKIGFDLNMSEQLAQITAVFEKTAEISTEKASSTLISAAQAFTQIGDLGEDDYVARVEAIGDRINAIGNQYSISSEGIADGLQNASAALKVAGNDLDETIALITAANKIFQSPSEVSNMLKVAAARLRGQVDALEEMGEDATGVSADITKIQQQIYELTGNKVNIFEDEDTLKSTYQMILEIGEVFDSLNDRSQADLLEVMFGKQRSSAGASLLLNYKELEKIKNDSMSAANSMAEEYSKYIESAEAHITIFKEKLVETYSTFMSGDLIKYTADVGSGILDLVNATDLLKHGILVVLALNVSKGITAVGTAIASTAKQMNTLGSALQQVKNLPTDKILKTKPLVEIGEATQNLTEKNLKLLLSNKNLGYQDKVLILQQHNLTEEEAKAKLQKMGLTTATNAQSVANVTEAASTNVLKGAMTSLKASIIGVGTSIKAAFMSNPIGFILTGITTAVSIATTIISKYKQSLNKANEAMSDAVSEYKSAKSSLENINSELREQSKKMDELLAKDKLTYAEKGQLEELKAITKELALQQDYEERRADKASKEAAKKTIDAYKKQYGKYDKTEDKMKEMFSYISPGISAGKNDVLGNIGEYISATASLEKAREDYQKALADGKDLSWYDENIQYHIDRLNNFSQILSDNISDLQGKQLSLEDEYQKVIARRESGLDLTSFDKEVIESYETISNLIRIAHEYSDPNTWKSMQIEKVFDTEGIEKTKEELVEMVKAGTFDENTIQSYPKLSEALEQNKVSASELRNELEALAEAEKVVEDDAFNDKDPLTFSTQLTKSEESLDKFQSAVKSAADAYATLLTGNYTSSELLDSIQAINKAVTDMGGSLDWEFINSQSYMDPLELLGDAIEHISEDYAKSVLSGAGINKNNDFYQTLVDIIKQTYEVEARFTGMNAQLDRLQSSYQTLTGILESYNETGYISLDNLQTLLTADENLIAMLEVENGKLVLNQKAYENLVAVQLLEFKEKLNNAAAAEIEALAKQKAEEATNNNADASNNAVEKLDAETKALKRNTEAAEENAIIKATANAEEAGVSEEDIQKVLDKYEELWNAAMNNYKSDFSEFMNGSKSSSSSSSEKDTTQEFDWIEQAIENVEKEVKELDDVVNSAYSTFSQKNDALAKEIGKVSEEIALQQKAYEEYMRKADSIGLSDDYKDLIRDGAINIENITDENIQQKISDYQQWYEKAVDVSEAISGLNEQMKDLHVKGYELQAERLEDLLDSNSITEKQYLTEMKSLYKEYYEDQVEYAQKAHEAKMALLEKEKSYLNSVANAASSLLDKEISNVQDNAKAQEEALNKQIDSHNAQIDLLNEKKKLLQDELDALENKARDENLILDLQQKQYDLKRAENQKLKLVYTADKGMVYASDHETIRNAKKDVDDAKLAIQKNDIQKQIDALDDEIDRYNDLIDLVNDQIDQINKAADAQIDALEKIKNKWQEVIDQQEYAKNLSLLTAEFGADAITKILTGNDDDLLAQWKESYINTLADIDMESQGYIGDMTQQMAGLYNVDLSSLQNQFQNVKESVDGVTNAIGNTNIGAVSPNVDTGDDSSSGNLTESIDGLGTAADESLPDVISYMDDIGTSAMNAASAVSFIADVLNSIPEEKDVTINVRTSGIGDLSEKPIAFAGSADFTGKAYADGTEGLTHDEKNALRSEHGQTELTVYPDGKTELTTQPIMSDLPKGTVVYNEEQTQKIMNAKPQSVGNAYADGTSDEGWFTLPDGSRARPLQPGDKAYDMMLAGQAFIEKWKASGEEFISNAYFAGQKQLEQLTKEITNNTAISNIVNNRNVQQPVVNQNVTINCPNVTNDSGVEHLQQQLGHLSLMATQVPLRDY